MYKAVFYILKGLIGILLNKNLTLKIKLYLYIDYAKLLLLALKYLFNPQRNRVKSGGVFYSKAFNYTMHYPTFPAFFFIFNEIFCIGVYSVVNNLKTYIDLGANIGLAILWYHFFYPNLITYAFEPDEENFIYLKKNIKLAKIKHCHLINKAVSNKSGTHIFYRLLDPVQNLDSSLTLNQDLPYETTTVKTAKISTVIKKIKKVSLIKMDIEGGEYDVFKDIFSNKLINKIDRIFFECHTPNKKTYASFIKISYTLKKCGSLLSEPNAKVTSMNYWQNKNIKR